MSEFSRVEISLSEDVGDGQYSECGATSEHHGGVELGMSLADALERCGYPRVLLVLAQAIDQSTLVGVSEGGEIKEAEDRLLYAAAGVIHAWMSHDEKLNSEAASAQLGTLLKTAESVVGGWSVAIQRCSTASQLTSVRRSAEHAINALQLEPQAYADCIQLLDSLCAKRLAELTREKR